MAGEEISHDYERRKGQAELNRWMGRMEQGQKDLQRSHEETKKQVKDHCATEERDRREFMGLLGEIKVTLAKAIICPYEADVKQVKKDVVEVKKCTEKKISDCKKDKGMVKEERKWIYGGIGMCIGGLAWLVKYLIGKGGGG